MSARNSLEVKRARKARKALTGGRLPEQVDLIHWVKQRAGVSTSEAERLILAGCLRVDSHKVGVQHNRIGPPTLRRYVPPDVAAKITVIVPKELS